MSAPQPPSTRQLKSLVDEVIEKLNPQTIIAELGSVQSTMKTLTNISNAAAGSLLTVGQIQQKFNPNLEFNQKPKTSHSKQYQSSENPPMIDPPIIDPPIIDLPQETGANINGHFYTLAKLRSVLSAILTITAVGLLAAGGFMAFANRDAIQDYVEDRIQPMVDSLNIDQVKRYLSIISKKITNYIKHSTSPVVAKLKSKFLKHPTTPLRRSQRKRSVRAERTVRRSVERTVRGRKNTKISSSRSKSDRRVKNQKSARITASRSKSARK